MDPRTKWWFYVVKFCFRAHIWVFYNIKCFYEVNLVQISLKKDFKNFFVT